MSGTLWIVATPIGNLEDITLRALRILREADLVLAEDTRRTRTLLQQHGIDTPLASLHAHSSAARVDALADELSAGRRYAMVTDAGTPLVSDPGSALVQAALARAVAVEAIPGPSAVIGALCVAGVRSDHFRFVGFLPRSGKRRREALQEIARDRLTTVLFESPNRVGDTLSNLREVCGDARPAAVCRELTKLHEQVSRGTLTELAHTFAEGTRGEVTLVVEGKPASEPEAERPEPEDLEALIRERVVAGQSAKDIARELAASCQLDRREVYAQVVRIKGEE